MAKFSSPPAGPLAAGLERDFCRCRLEVLHLFENFTPSVTPRQSLAAVLHTLCQDSFSQIIHQGSVLF